MILFFCFHHRRRRCVSTQWNFFSIIYFGSVSRRLSGILEQSTWYNLGDFVQSSCLSERKKSFFFIHYFSLLWPHRYQTSGNYFWEKENAKKNNLWWVSFEGWTVKVIVIKLPSVRRHHHHQQWQRRTQNRHRCDPSGRFSMVWLAFFCVI